MVRYNLDAFAEYCNTEVVWKVQLKLAMSQMRGKLDGTELIH